VKWINLACKRNKWRIVINVIINLQPHKDAGFPELFTCAFGWLVGLSVSRLFSQSVILSVCLSVIWLWDRVSTKIRSPKCSDFSASLCFMLTTLRFQSLHILHFPIFPGFKHAFASRLRGTQGCFYNFSSVPLTNVAPHNPHSSVLILNQGASLHAVVNLRISPVICNSNFFFTLCILFTSLWKYLALNVIRQVTQ
jgi:hypothetical protein